MSRRRWHPCRRRSEPTPCPCRRSRARPRRRAVAGESSICRKPSSGLEPETPSLPCRSVGNRPQPTATVFACLSRSSGRPICDRLPPVATTGLHKGSVLKSSILTTHYRPGVREGATAHQQGRARRKARGKHLPPCVSGRSRAFSFIGFLWRHAPSLSRLSPQSSVEHGDAKMRWGQEDRPRSGSVRSASNSLPMRSVEAARPTSEDTGIVLCPNRRRKAGLL